MAQWVGSTKQMDDMLVLGVRLRGVGMLLFRATGWVCLVYLPNK